MKDIPRKNGRHLNARIRRQQILSAIAKHQPIMAKQIAVMVELHIESVRTYTRQMRKEGRIRRIYNSYWVLP